MKYKKISTVRWCIRDARGEMLHGRNGDDISIVKYKIRDKDGFRARKDEAPRR